MLKFSYSEIVEKIQKEKSLSKEEIDKKIKEKMAQLSDLVSMEGAAHIVANQLGVKLFENFENKELKINDVPKAANAITIAGRVVDFWGIREFNKNGRSGRVANFLIGDETGAVRIVVWDEPIINKVANLKEGDIVRVKNSYSRENRGYMELHLGSRSEIDINPKGVEIGEVNIKLNSPKATKKNINELKEGDESELFGTIVRMFDPNFYFVCPNCMRKVIPIGAKYNCNEHGEVEAKKMPVFNLFFDDGTESIRSVVFAQQTKDLIGSEFSEDSNLEAIKSELLGKQIILIGRAVKNQMFGRLEFVVRAIKEADPSQLIKELEK
ncbi:MAG: OB-fold nucleic acid binding domain-containing protein [Candidatus Woesearchaeota archaeon]